LHLHPAVVSLIRAGYVVSHDKVRTGVIVTAKGSQILRIEVD
jgi:hypothetical protein